jgi:hypothetical protein
MMGGRQESSLMFKQTISTMFQFHGITTSMTMTNSIACGVPADDIERKWSDSENCWKMLRDAFWTEQATWGTINI